MYKRYDSEDNGDQPLTQFAQDLKPKPRAKPGYHIRRNYEKDSSDPCHAGHPVIQSAGNNLGGNMIHLLWFVPLFLIFWAIVHGGTRYDKKESTIQKDSASKSEF